MPAFELAVEQGADMAELDVQRSADGIIVVFHDETTERWDGRKRLVSECTLAELSAVSIGGARIPTLAEVCAFARENRLQLNIELKGRGFGDDVVRVVREERAEDLVLFSSFWPSALAEAAASAPHIPRGYLMGTRTYRPDVRFRESWPFLALRQTKSMAWHPAYQIPMLERVIPRVRRIGYQVNVWTVNEVALMRRLVALGVDGIITDAPNVLRQVLQEAQASSSAASL
jgi:glycerophosphoryl diester phosphodiesterase